MTPRLRSVFLVCRDLLVSANFYRGLGFEELPPGRRSRKFSLSGEMELHLHEQLSEQERETFQVCWQRGSSGQVLSFGVDDLEALQESIPAGFLLVPVRETPWGTRMLMVSDPDGHRLEFQEPVVA